jgi:DNA-directed RNA polymerase subunit beta'
MRELVIGRVLAANIINEKTGEPIAEADTMISADLYQRLLDEKVTEISLYLNDDETGEATEKMQINITDADAAVYLKEKLEHGFLGKEIVGDIVNAEGKVIAKNGTKLTEKEINQVLADDSIHAVRIRNNEITGVEIGAITEGRNKQTIIESLQDRITGRFLAEPIKNKGKVLYPINTYITDAIAEKIAAIREKVKVRSVLTCKSKIGVCCKCYGRNLATDKIVDVGEAVGTIAAQAIGEPGTQLTMRTFHTGGVAGGDDITQGLPRVEELFEARKPKHPGVIAENAGTVHISEENGQRKITVTGDAKSDVPEQEYAIPYGAKLAVAEDAQVEVGDSLTEGSLNPHDILRISGVQATQRYIVQQVLGVYKSQGVEINDKHIEVMVRQMMRKIRVDEAGDTNMLPGDYVDVADFEAQNAAVVEAGKEPAEGRPILLGITKASLATDSFLSAASFQETTRVLTDAAIKGKVDPLVGLKENVIIGKLIPAGTGMRYYRDIQLDYENQQPEDQTGSPETADAVAPAPEAK